MDGQVSFRNFRFNVNSRVSMSAMALAMICALTLLTTHFAQAQTFSVLHYFTGGADGAIPYAGVTVGPSGVLYGTATTGGTHNHGTVFKLSQTNSSWVSVPCTKLPEAAMEPRHTAEQCLDQMVPYMARPTAAVQTTMGQCSN